MTRHRSTIHRFAGCASGAAVMLTFLAFAGTASAGTSKANAHSAVYSAAHAQYGQQKVLKPTVAAVASKKTSHVAAATRVHPLKTTKTVGSLPFTGLSLLNVALIAFGLMALGFILRRQTSRDN